MPDYTIDLVCTPLPEAQPLPASVELLHSQDIGDAAHPDQLTLRVSLLRAPNGAQFIVTVMQFLLNKRYELVRFNPPLINRAGMQKTFNVPASTVAFWLREPSFPRPVADVARGRVWHYHDIEAWLVNYGYHEPPEILYPTWLEIAEGYATFEALRKRFAEPKEPQAPAKLAPDDDYKVRAAEAMRRLNGGYRG